MITAAITYARALTAGWAARVWRVLTSGDCPCEFCRAHRAFTAGADWPAMPAENPTAARRLPTRAPCMRCDAPAAIEWPGLCATCAGDGNATYGCVFDSDGDAYLPTLDEIRWQREAGL